MDLKTEAKAETRTFAKYIRAKLGCSAASFAESQGIPVSTLNDRWISPKGKIQIMTSVYRVYVLRFEEL
jgi:hypothetical protein